MERTEEERETTKTERSKDERPACTACGGHACWRGIDGFVYVCPRCEDAETEAA